MPNRIKHFAAGSAKSRPLAGLTGAFLALVVITAVWAGPASAADKSAVHRATADQFEADRDRLVAAGARFKPDGFPEFPSYQTPFEEWRKLDTGRMTGRQVYVSLGGHRIWKTLFCGNPQEVFLELSLLTREGQRIAFAWQSCAFYCGDAGRCSLANPLYIDINGDGVPEIKFPMLKRLIRVDKGFIMLRSPRYNFTIDILPHWLKCAVGPDFKNLSTVGPSDSVGYWLDNPLKVESDSNAAR